jgi:hypothetical protein
VREFNACEKVRVSEGEKEKEKKIQKESEAWGWSSKRGRERGESLLEIMCYFILLNLLGWESQIDLARTFGHRNGK